MDKIRTAENAAVILATPEQRRRWEYDPADAERAIRSARRQVQRYGDDARAAFLRFAQTDDERGQLERALSTARVGTVTLEWIGRG